MAEEKEYNPYLRAALGEDVILAAFADRSISDNDHAFQSALAAIRAAKDRF